MTRRAIITTVHPHGAGVAVGSHHLARELARRGWRVLLLSDPASLVHIAMAPFNAAARARTRASFAGWYEIAPGLETWTPAALVPLAGKLGAGSAAMLDIWPRATVPRVVDRLRRAGYYEPDLLVLDGALHGALIDDLHPGKAVFRMFDHPDGRLSLPMELQRRERDLIVRADMVAVTAQGLVSVAERAGAQKVHLFENGVDLAPFALSHAEPADLAAIPRPRAIYVGAIEPWVNQDLVNQVAHLLPGVSFVWIGPGRARPLLPDAPNIYRLGSKQYTAVPAYLLNADVGLIPFDRAGHSALVDTINPLKLYEYAAAGLPVVATPWPEIERIGGPVVFAGNAASFARALDTVLAAPKPLTARAFAERSAWSKRVDGLLEGVGISTK